MLSFLRVLLERLQALLLSHATVALETELLTLNAARRAGLLHLAEQYDQEGLPSLAQLLRQQAEALSFTNPLGSVTETMAGCQEGSAPCQSVLFSATKLTDPRNVAVRATPPAANKKGAKP